MKYLPTDLCHIDNMTCFGCCGHHFTSKKDIERALILNTLTYIKHRDDEKPIKDFRDRSKLIRSCGICFNLVLLDFEKDKKARKIGCPLHPKLNNGKDLREGYCEIDHLCKAAFMFNEFDDNMKEKFLKLIKSKNLDWYDYSLKMDNNELINEFLSNPL